jgi:hypothetical protein
MHFHDARIHRQMQVELRAAVMRAVPSDHVLYNDLAAFKRDKGVLDLYQGSRHLAHLTELASHALRRSKPLLLREALEIATDTQATAIQKLGCTNTLRPLSVLYGLCSSVVPPMLKTKSCRISTKFCSIILNRLLPLLLPGPPTRVTPLLLSELPQSSTCHLTSTLQPRQISRPALIRQLPPQPRSSC